MSLPSRTVLVVEASSEDREFYRRCLSSDRACTYTFLEASLGQQGLSLWQQHQPDAVVLAAHLPDLDALEFLNGLQTVSQDFCIPVIVVGRQGNEAIAVQTMKAGACDYLLSGQITPQGLQLAVDEAIEAVQLRAQLHQRIAAERLVSHITQKIHQTLDLAAILQTAVDEIRQFLQSDRVLIFRLQPDGWGTVTTESVGSGWIPFLSTSHYDPCLSEDHIQPFRQGRVTVRPDIYDGHLDACHVELLTKLQVRANLVVPILQDEQLWGMLIVHHCSMPRQWQPLEIDLLKELSAQVSIALRQAELYQQSQTELAERKRVEAELRESKERLQLALTASGMGTWDWNIQTGHITWSDNLEALFGLEPGQFDGSFEMFCQRLHPDDCDRVLAAIEQAIATQANYDIEFRIVYPNGRIRWALSQGKVLYDPNGQPLRMAGIDLDITERKQAEQALRNSEERLQMALDGSGGGLWDWNIATNEDYLSLPWLKMLGYEEGDLPENYNSWEQLIHPEDKGWVLERLQAHLQDDSMPYEFEYRLLTKSGEWKWIANYGKVVSRDLQGHPLRMSGIHHDINERKQAEQALRNSEERFRSSVENMLDCFAIYRAIRNQQGQIIDFQAEYINDAACHSSQIEREQHLSRGLCELLPGHRDSGLFDEYCQVVTTGEPLIKDSLIYEDEFGHQRLTRAFDIRVAKFGDGYVASWRDMTDRQQAVLALQESEQKLSLFIEYAPVSIAMFDRNMHYVAVSQGWVEMYQLESIAAVLGRSHYEIFPHIPARWRQVHQRGLAGITEKFEEDRFTLADGSEQCLRWEVHPWRVGSGEVGGILILVEDVWERQQVEQERTRLLEQEQSARAAAERANRIKDEFLAVLSHELRSPLNPILGWTKLLQTRNFNPTRTAEALATIERNAKLQTQLIDDLLDVAKILRGKLSIDTVPVDLVFVIESAIDTVRTAAIAKSIWLHPQLTPVGRVAGDAARLQQIVWNLLSNAVKFTPNQGRVDIRLSKVGTQAQITISDTGKGINRDFLPYLFESFRQEDTSITRQYGGLGLGLAIVRSLVEAHGGTITADSPGEGQGASFTVQLPLLDPEAYTQPPDELLAQDLNLSGIRILAVDDEADARELLAVLLTQYGAEVMVVDSAAAVLAQIASFQPDVLISDIGMPEMDGYTLLQQLRALPAAEGGQVPAIALTAYAREEDQQRAIASGFQRQMTKPLEPEQLVQATLALIRSQPA